MSSNCSYAEQSSEDGNPSERWLGEEHYGFIEFCKCGSPMFMARESSPAHRGRIYYKCTNFRANGEHCSKWFDEVIDEEIKNIKLVVKNHTAELTRLRDRVNASVEPFSVRFSHEVTKLNICITNLQRELEQIDRKYANVCNVPGFYESRRWWLKDVYVRSAGPACTAIGTVSKKLRFSRKATFVLIVIVALISVGYALYRSRIGPPKFIVNL